VGLLISNLKLFLRRGGVFGCSLGSLFSMNGMFNSSKLGRSVASETAGFALRNSTALISGFVMEPNTCFFETKKKTASFDVEECEKVQNYAAHLPTSTDLLSYR
jgi:hypothetical protein